MKKRCSVKPYDGNEKYIFISYCHKDRAQVFPIIEQLAKDGYRIWYDEGIDPGSEWPEIIASHLNKSAICIAFITENALNSHNCRREINFALMKMKKLISVILESVEMSLGMEMQLSATQSVFKYKLSGTDEFFSKLYSAHDMDECKGAPDNTIVVSKPEDYEPEDYSDKREPFSDKWFVEDISDKKKPTAVSVAIETAPAQAPEPLPVESAPAQDAEPLPAETAPAQDAEPLSAQSKSKFAKDVDALFAKSEADNAHHDDIKAAESEELQPAKAVYDADDADDATVEKKKKLPLWIKIAAIAAAVIAAAAAVLLLIKANNDGQAVYVAESEYSDENTDDSSDSSANDEQSDASEESSTASDTSSTSKEDDTSSADVTQTDKTDSSSPKWEETEASGVKYVTVDCYSRKEAVVGSKRVELHKQGSSVKIIAKTDTDYYKLEDGSFIHKDYLSDTDPSQSASQPQTQKPAETEKPQTQKPVTEKPQTQKPATEKPNSDYNSSPAEDFTTRLLTNGTLEISSYVGNDDKVVIPSSISGVKVTSIGESAFSNNNNSINYEITEIYIPAGIKSINVSSLYSCYYLKKITVDSNNNYYSSENGVLYNKNKTTLLSCPRDKTGSFTIPDTVTEVAEDAFLFSQLSNINISASNNIKEIGEGAFNYCNNLRYFEIPDGVTIIKQFTFYDTPLTTVVIPKSVKEIDINAFVYNDYLNVKLEKVYYGGTVEEWNNLILGNNILDDVELHTGYTR